MFGAIRKCVIFVTLIFFITTSYSLTYYIQASDYFSGENLELVYALDKGDEGEVKKLLEKGVLIDGDEHALYTPLLFFISEENVTATRLTIEMGADPNFTPFAGYSPVVNAASKHNSECLTLLLDAGGDPDSVDGRGESATFSAIKGGELENLRLLIESGADINKIYDGMNALLYAASKEEFDIVHYLLEKEVDYRMKDSDGFDARWYVEEYLKQPVSESNKDTYEYALDIKKYMDKHR